MLKNKYFWLVAFGVVVLATGFVYQNYFRPEDRNPISSGREIEINVRVVENTWTYQTKNDAGEWVNQPIEVTVGDRVVLNIANEDGFDHGFAIDALGVNRRLFANRTTRVEFVASREGNYPFYCSVPCGEGHFRHTGKLMVVPAVLIGENQSLDIIEKAERVEDGVEDPQHVHGVDDERHAE